MFSMNCQKGSASKLPTRLPTTRPLRAPRRRSNSFDELKDKFLASSSTKDIQNFKPPTRPVALRRSKSYGDLRSTQNKALPLKTADVLVKGLKRQNAIDSEITIKKTKVNPLKTNTDKAIKPTKPAPYDYKARYNLLLEKHKSVKGAAVETQQQLDELKKNLEDVIVRSDLQAAELDKSKIKTYKLELELTTRSKNLECITKENEQHKLTLEKLQAEKEDLQQTCKAQSSQLAHLNQELIELGIYKCKCTELEARIHEYSQAEIEYKEALQKAEHTRRYLHNLIQELKGNIRVFCRVRPADSDRLECNINYLNENTLEIKKSKESITTVSGKMSELKMEFSFDRIYPPQAEQQEIFDELSQLVQSAIDGYHVCVFAYGQTGSGKTYTMQGMNNPDQQGMIPRSIMLLFDTINHVELANSEFQIHASFLEIYNENLHDLLKPNNKEKLCIQYNEGKGVIVTNLTIAPVQTAEDLTSLMKSANINRAVAATDFNEHSSRSHAVTKIYIKSINKSTQAVFEGSLNFVDLAGSESAKTSSCERLCETKNINKSLSALGSVMLALHNKNVHIPYRNSKLTYLLQSCLGGNSKTLMILNISPFEDCYGETLNSLRFATKVKNVKTDCRRNKTYATLDKDSRPD